MYICFASTTTESNDSILRDSQQRCAEITSLSINSANETTGVTSFVQEACENVTVFGDLPVVRTLYPKDATAQNLTEYFRRPVALSSGTLATSVRSRLEVDDFTNNSLFGAFPNGKDRLSGVFGVRCTIVFTLQVATSPFHQGLLALSWQYDCGNTDTDKYIRSSNSQTATNLPHVKLDLSTDTMVQLRVPFLNEYEYAPVNSGATFNWGVLALNAILPIPSVVGIAAPAYQILIHLEDMEFFGATPNSTTTLLLQSGKKLAPITKEFEQDSHPFSSATMALSRTVRFLGMGVPLLSSVGGPTSWFLEKLAGSIRSFGFARPQVCEPTQRMFTVDNIGEQNVDVATTAQVVGPLSTNTLRVSPIFGASDVDEMSLKYVLSQWNQVNFFPISTSDAPGTAMYATGVSPSFMWFRAGATAPYCNILPPVIAPAGTNGFSPSGLFYFGSMFKLWRGAIKFKFTFAKTKMHGGRIMVCYNPLNVDFPETTTYGVKPTITIPVYGTNGPDPFGYSAIFNFRDGNVFEFVVPYTSPRPFTGFSGYTGGLVMYVVDALQAPSVVSSTIHCMVEVCAGDDFELANVRSVGYPSQPNPTLTLQSGKILGGAPEDICEHTVGECITSLKQLIAIPKVTSITGAANTKYSFTIQPWFYQPRPSLLIPAPTTNLTESFGFGGNISKCYTYVKGGTDFHAYLNQANTTGKSWISVAQISNTQTLTTTQSPAQVPFSSNPRIINSKNGSLHARLPAFQQQLRFNSSCLDTIVTSTNAWGLKGTNNPTFTWNPTNPTALYSATMWSNAVTQIVVTRAAADDAAMAMYIGPPPLLLLSSNTAATLYDVDSDTAIF